MRVSSCRATALLPAGRNVVLVGAFALAGCAELADGTDSLSAGNQQGQGRLEPELDWSCLPISASRSGNLIQDRGTPIQYRIQIASLFGGALQDIQARACLPIDIGCGAAIDEAEGAVDGFVTLTLFSGFDGFLEISAQGMIPIVFYPFNDLFESTEYPRPLNLAPEGSLDTLAEDSGVTFRTDLAHVTIQSFDCLQQRAPGIQFSHNRGGGVGNAFYFASNVPSPRATQTDGRGVGGFLNLPPRGGVTVAAARAVDGEVIGSRSVTLRPGWFTTVDLIPR